MDPLALLLKVLSLAATAVFFLALGLMLLTFRRARTVTPPGLLVPVAVSVLVLAIYGLALRSLPRPGWLLLGLAAGGLVGALWARTHRLFVAGARVRSQANLWYLAVWGAVLGLNQLVVLVSGRSSRVLMGMLVLSTGIALGNSLALLRRYRRLRAAAAGALVAGALLAAGPPAAVRADDVLLLLPRSFDVRAETPKGAPVLTFRFRGQEFTAESRWDRGDAEYQYVSEERMEGTFRRGHLEGSYRLVNNGSTSRQTNNDHCPAIHTGPYYRLQEDGTVEGTADADGKLTVRVRVTSHHDTAWRTRYVGGQWGCYADVGWVDITEEHETQWAVPWKPRTATIELRLPVGELQSNQKLSTPSPRRVETGPGATRRPQSSVAEKGATSSEGAPGTEAAPGEEGSSREGVGDGSPDDNAGVPVSPAESAAAAAGAALVSVLGALWMLGSSGLGLGDLFGALPPPETAGPLPPPADALPPTEPPRILFQEPPHGDGDVNPDTGEVWSVVDGGWVGSDFYDLQKGAWDAQVSRAQAVSQAESRGRSQAISDGLRASRQRQAEAAAREADAARRFELEAQLRPETIEPYQPGWTESVLVAADKGTDFFMSTLANVTGPDGQALNAGYTALKETARGLSEGVANVVRGKGGYLAGEGSPLVVLERMALGFTKGVAKVWLDKAAGEALTRLGAPTLPDMGGAALREVGRALATGEGRRVVGIALGQAEASRSIQLPFSERIDGI